MILSILIMGTSLIILLSLHSYLKHTENTRVEEDLDGTFDEEFYQEYEDEDIEDDDNVDKGE